MSAVLGYGASNESRSRRFRMYVRNVGDAAKLKNDRRLKEAA
jgi:hypothetical protein